MLSAVGALVVSVVGALVVSVRGGVVPEVSMQLTADCAK